jgi:hypothetical protein
MTSRVSSGAFKQAVSFAGRLGLMVGTFSAVELGTALVRDKDDWLNGATAGILFGLAFGVVGMAQ